MTKRTRKGRVVVPSDVLERFEQWCEDLKLRRVLDVAMAEGLPRKSVVRYIEGRRKTPGS